MRRSSLVSFCWIISLPIFFRLGSAHWIDLHAWYNQFTSASSPPQPNVAGVVGRFDPKYQNDPPYSNKNVTSSGINTLEESPPNFGAIGVEMGRKLPGCRDLKGLLSEAQVHICQLFHDHMGSLVQGARLGLTECRWQFRHHQWNCSGLGLKDTPPGTPGTKSGRSSGGGIKTRSIGHATKAKLPFPVTYSTATTEDPTIEVTTPELASSVDWNSLVSRGSKEIAFAHAVWSAAVTQSIARSCRDGSLTSCGCGRTLRPSELKNEWRWGGCGDNLQYGYKFSQNFVDSPEQEKPVLDKREKAKILANLHNNEAGRRSVLKKTKIACKCHGVSGSCALVTCWHQVPSFREIGDHLKERYARATLVKLNKRGRLQVKRSADPVPTVYDLVYVESSPNYCHRNETAGIFGTTGRICNRTSTAPDSCKNLCCNRGFTTRVVKSAQRCKCKFIWCCQVVCAECSQMQKYDVCK